MVKGEVVIGQQSQHLLAKLQTHEKLSVLRCARVANDQFEGCANRFWILQEDNDLFHLLDFLGLGWNELSYSRLGRLLLYCLYHYFQFPFISNI